jgi:excisionase family DNA binding protein
MKAGLWLSVGEAARELGLTYPRTARAIYEGDLEAVMINGRWRVASWSVSKLKKDTSESIGLLQPRGQ